MRQQAGVSSDYFSFCCKTGIELGFDKTQEQIGVALGT